MNIGDRMWMPLIERLSDQTWHRIKLDNNLTVQKYSGLTKTVLLTAFGSDQWLKTISMSAILLQMLSTFLDAVCKIMGHITLREN